MSKEKINESTDSSKKRSIISEELIQHVSNDLIQSLNAGSGDYIERWNDYLERFEGSDTFPNKIAHDMIRAWRWDEVFRHIDKFKPTQTLAKALLKDMIKNWFYEDKDERAMGYNCRLLEDSIAERDDFLSKFWKLDNSTAVLVLKLLEKNLYTDYNAVYKEHLWDCFPLQYFTELDEDVLNKLSNRWKVVEDEDQKRFVWIDSEKREKYTNIALSVQNEASKIEEELEEEYTDEEFDEI